MALSVRDATYACVIVALYSCGGRTSLDDRPMAPAFDASSDQGIATNHDFKIVYFVSDPLNPIGIWHSKTQTMTQLPFAAGGSAPTFTYDGRFIATGSISPPDYLTEVDLLDANGLLLRAQHPPAGKTWYVSDVRPDAQQLLLNTATTGGTTDRCMATLDADGSYAELLCGWTGWMRYAPDGKTIVFTDDTFGISTIRDDGTELTRIVDQGAEPSFSFDGSLITYIVSTSSETGSVNVVNVATLSVDSMTDVGWRSSPRFTPDGTGVLFVEQQPHTNGLYSIRRVDLKTHDITTILADSGSHGYLPPQISVAPDQ